MRTDLAATWPKALPGATGPMDLMLRLRVRDHEHLRHCLFDKIWKLPGVNRTETYLSLSASDTKLIDVDLIRMLRSGVP